MKEHQSLNETDYISFTKLLKEVSGLHYEKGKRLLLTTVLSERLEKTGLASYRDYYNYLKFDIKGPNELLELIDMLTIGETYFNRNIPQFEALNKFVIPDIVKSKCFDINKNINVWSAGCSNGAETYSIAISLLETLPNPTNWNIYILGTDIDRIAIKQAQQGKYNQRDVKNISEEHLEKYFEKIDSHYYVRDFLKNTVKFQVHNLITFPYMEKEMKGLDILFCRNVTIYFDFETTKNIIANFYHSLRIDGYLFLGHAETLWQVSTKFKIIEFPQTFIYQKAAHSVKMEIIKPFVGIPEVKVASTPLGHRYARPPSEVEGPLGHRIEGLLGHRQKEQTREYKNQLKELYLFAIELAKKGEYQDAISELNKILEKDNLFTDAYYLSGVLNYKVGNLSTAEEQFKKVLYIDHNFILAYFNLGNIFLYEKHFQKARREFTNALRLLNSDKINDIIGFSPDYDIEFLIKACENNLKRINENVV
ncbi:CheR family methyltransferase [Candidatus Margulisiibacteriota bacterium]